MPLVTMKSLLQDAEKGKYAVGGFNVANMEMVLGIIKAAEELKAPIILQIAECRLDYSPLNVIGPSMVAAAKAAKVPVAVNLDHGLTIERVKEALDIGFSSVMIDGSRFDMPGNIKITNEVCELAKAKGATVEAEIGAIHKGNEKVVYTDVDEAVNFWKSVDIDALAIAIGNAHGLYHGIPKLNFDVLTQCDKRISIPLVLHGGTGISEEDFKKCIELGIRKINVATATFNSVEDHVHKLYNAEDEVGYWNLTETEVKGAYDNVKRHIMMFGSAGKA